MTSEYIEAILRHGWTLTLQETEGTIQLELAKENDTFATRMPHLHGLDLSLSLFLKKLGATTGSVDDRL